MLHTNINKDLWTNKTPYISSKKKVSQAYNPNSYRIFADEISDNSKLGKLCHRSNTADQIKTFSRTKPETNYYWNGLSNEQLKRPGYINNHPREPNRRNCPHPNSAGFLRSNVRVLNAAIPFIKTDSTAENQKSWWHKDGEVKKFSEDEFKEYDKRRFESSLKYYNLDNKFDNFKNEKVNLSASCDNIKDIQSRKKYKQHLSNQRSLKPNQIRQKIPIITRAKPPPTSNWILKQNFNKSDRFLEHISYRHGYNSRLDKNEPIRGKLPGNFVWKELRKNSTVG